MSVVLPATGQDGRQVHRASRSEALCVSVSALPGNELRVSGELTHISSSLCEVLVNLLMEVLDGYPEASSSREIRGDCGGKGGA